jgi:hypothetical protein
VGDDAWASGFFLDCGDRLRVDFSVLNVTQLFDLEEAAGVVSVDAFTVSRLTWLLSFFSSSGKCVAVCGEDLLASCCIS